MGFRFRKSVTIIPGVRLNFSKSGISTSVGGPGATVNFGAKGTRKTIGIPGSGLSFHSISTGTQSNGDYRPQNSGDAGGIQNPSKIGIGCGCIALVLASLILIGFCAERESGDPTKSDNSGQSAGKNIIDGDIVYITAKSLNARTSPSTNSRAVTTLSKGEVVKVLEKKNGWLKVVKGGAMLWIAADHVATQRETKLIDSDEPASGTVQPNALSSSYKQKPPIRSAKKPQSIDTYKNGRGITSGRCPCNGGAVCVGPRGGRYCITRSGRKRYGV